MLIRKDIILCTTGISLMIVIGLLSYNLYINNKTCNGKPLDGWDIIKKIFNRSIDQTEDAVDDLVNEVKDIYDTTFTDKSVVEEENNIKKEVTEVKKDCSLDGSCVEKPPKKKKCKTCDNEVFNISNNNYTYEEASKVCQAYDSELATYDQVLEAHKKGANWCNYGWSQNQLALYPIQQSFYDKLQAAPNNVKEACGEPGVNGGFFKDGALKFGVNCFGKRPKPDPARIVYTSKVKNNKEIQDIINQVSLVKKDTELEKIKKDIKNNNIDLMPYSDSYWGSCSKKKSYYINAEPNNKLGIKSCKNKDDNGININDYDGEITEEIFEVISGNV